MIVRYILISFLCSLLFGHSLFVARRPTGFVAASRSLTRSKPALSVLAFFLKVMFVPQAGFSAGVNVFTSHKAEAAVKTHHFGSKNCDETVINNVFSTGTRRVLRSWAVWRRAHQRKNR